jgi:hypothetical protein
LKLGLGLGLVLALPLSLALALKVEGMRSVALLSTTFSRQNGCLELKVPKVKGKG